ncbi:stalk domain-containing protein [Paenibacillus donghaensis]|uniref:Glycosyl hydrolase n=1 Tax=Paenibacillus donghaensis TaxID=414771 RepID=A0A2Z2K6M2_9BACL|nr:stalk domain-containing protein [Paenibacillus donghaensis]ASA20514.1 glycosyl hydrolase [Paenibacillus donghaensis]
MTSKLAKLFLGVTLTFGSLTVIPQSSAYAAAGGVSIMLDGYPLPFPVAPVMMKGTTMVPFRAISEALGIQVEWNQKARKITATKTDAAGKKTVVLTLGSKNAVVNGAVVPLAVAPQDIRGTTMLPLSFFGQQFGAGVSWSQATKTVSITSPKKDMYTLGFYALESYDQIAMLPSFDAAAFGWSQLDQSGQYTTAVKPWRWPQPAGDVTPESIIQNAAAAGTAPYLMVFSEDGSLELTKNLEDKQLQEQTISGIIDTAVQNGFKGIALDLEQLGFSGDKAKAKADYNAFVQKLTQRAHAANLQVTVIVHPLNSAYTGYDYKTLGTLADDLILMAYAYGDQKSPEPTGLVDEAIRLALKEVNKDKLILGISTASENESSMNTKIGLAKRYNLKGVAFWRLGIIGTAEWAEMQKSLELQP